MTSCERGEADRPEVQEVLSRIADALAALRIAISANSPEITDMLQAMDLADYLHAALLGDIAALEEAEAELAAPSLRELERLLNPLILGRFRQRS